MSKEMYNWGTFECLFPNGACPTLSAVDYKGKRETKYTYGKGHQAVGYSRGNYAGDGSFEIKMEDWDGPLGLKAVLIGLSTDGTLLSHKPFTITCMYAADGQKTIVHTLKGVQIQEIGAGLKQEDENVPMKFPIKFEAIHWDGIPDN